MTLEQMRAKIDEINEEILQLLAKRQGITQQIAHYKKEHGLAVQDERREQEQLKKLKEVAARWNLSQALVEKVFFLIVEESKEKMRGAK